MPHAHPDTDLGSEKQHWKGKGKAARGNVLSPKMAGAGPVSSDVMLVVEAPEKSDDERGEAFTGIHGQAIDKFLGKAGLDRTRFYATHAVKCRPPPGADGKPAPPKWSDAVYCSAFLSEEIRRVKPRIIVAFGACALRSLTGARTAKITEAHANPINITVAGHACILFPLWHPSFVFREDWRATAYADAFKKLARVIHGRVEVEDDGGKYIVARKAETALKILDKFIRLDENALAAFDFETSDLKAFTKGQRIACLSLARRADRGYAVPLYATERLVNLAVKHRLTDADLPEEIARLGWSADDYAEALRRARAWLASPCRKVGHNAKFDMHWAEAIFGVVPSNVTADTMLMHYATDENSTHALKPLALKYTNMGAYDDQLDREVAKTGKRYDLVPWKKLGFYAAKDAVATIRVYRALRDEMKRPEQGEATENLALRVLPRAMRMLQRMEARGVHIDLAFAKMLRGNLDTRVAALDRTIRSHPVVRRFIRDHQAKSKNFKFSLNSTKQMPELFYDNAYFGYPHSADKFTPTGQRQVDKEALQDFQARHGCAVAAAKQETGLLSKLLSTYVETFQALAMRHRTGQAFINANFNLHVARTGRLSSSNPALQQIPAKGAGAVKRMFTSRFGAEGVLIQADYSQIELRLTASVSGDPSMLKIYREGKDIHKNTMKAVFAMTDADCDSLEKEQPNLYKQRRTVAKRVNFGVVYGIGAEGIVNLLRGEGILVDQEEAREYIDRMFDAYPGVRRWIERTHRELEAAGYVQTPLGRKRRLPPVFSADNAHVARAKRQGVNDLIQSPASDLMLTALIRLDEYLARKGIRAFPILTVHDSVLLDSHRCCAAHAIRVVASIMENVDKHVPGVWGRGHDLGFIRDVPLQADIEVGVSWRDMEAVDAHAEDMELDAAIARSRERAAREDAALRDGAGDYGEDVVRMKPARRAS